MKRLADSADLKRPNGTSPSARRFAITFCTRINWSKTRAPSPERSDVEAVLDGDIDEFIKRNFLLFRKGMNEQRPAQKAQRN